MHKACAFVSDRGRCCCSRRRAGLVYPGKFFGSSESARTFSGFGCQV